MVRQLNIPRYARWLVLACAVLPATVSAEPKGEGKAALRRMEQRARSAEQAKAAAEAKLGELGEEADKAKAKAASLEKRRTSLEKELRQLREEKAALAEKLATTEIRLSERNAELASVAATLTDRESRLIAMQNVLSSTQQERQAYFSELGLRTQELGTCNTKNSSLQKTAEDLLKRYRSKTCTDVMLEKEPVTGLKRVKLENELDEYREKLERDATAATVAAQRKEADQAEALRRQELAEERAHLDKRERLATERRRAEKFKEQKKLDDLTRGVKNFFEGIEW